MSQAGLRQLGTLRPLDRETLTVPAPDAARRLLGAVLVRAEPHQNTVVRIVETEAYREDDPASHSYGGITPTRAPMFDRAGTAYVYVSYGIHLCANVSCESEGVGAAVLLRAAVTLQGQANVRRRRGERPRERDLLAGPGRLAQGLGITRDMSGADLLDANRELWLATDGWRPEPGSVVAGPRVGVRLAADVAWRFHLEGVPEVSRYSRHPKAPRRRA